jgi:hypothetical protein
MKAHNLAHGGTKINYQNVPKQYNFSGTRVVHDRQWQNI